MSSYNELVKDSLKAASMEHGLQTGAVYWEYGSYDFLPRVYGYAPRQVNHFLMGTQARDFFKKNTRVQNFPYIFHGDRDYARVYHGEPNTFEIVPLKKKFNFSFFPAATKDIYEHEHKDANVATSAAIDEIFKTALRVDLLKNIH
eukprot:GDKH01023875.1.p1 GENE.GDKH01023875.1~~GDKH01023875.1.p1  ORF type:complete len:145 (+),score=28.43 GDKH01023875.1:13-447(+)